MKNTGTQGIKITLKERQQEKKEKKEVFEQAKSKFIEIRKKIDDLVILFYKL